MIFTSKKDIWLGIIIWALIALFFWIFYVSIFVQFEIFGTVIMPILIYMLVSIWFNTQYKFEKHTLIISYGPFKKSILIQDIQTVRNTTNLFVAPALSMYKVEINYGKYETISISPKDLKRFVMELQIRNSQIQIKLNRSFII